MQAKLRLFLYALILSAEIALVAFAFLFAENGLWKVLWEQIPHYLSQPRLYRVALIVIGTTLLLLVKRYWGNLPHNAHSVIDELKQTHTIDYSKAWRNMLAALVVLAFGAGVGPEATLVGIVASYSIWEADKLRWLVRNNDEFHRSSFSKKLAILFQPNRYLLSGKAENQLNQVIKHKKLFDGLLFFNGIVLFWLLVKLTDQPSFVTKVGPSRWQTWQLWVMPFLMLYGGFFGSLYRQISQKLLNWSEKFTLSIQARVIIAAVMMGILAWYFPQLLFSGQHSMHWAVNLGVKESAIKLLGMALLKLIFLDVCLWGTWIGGNIFPIIFASLLNGFAIAQLMPSFDTTLIVMIVSMASAIGLLGNIWLAGIFMMLFFPLNLWPVAVLLMLLWLVWQRLCKRIWNIFAS